MSEILTVQEVFSSESMSSQMEEAVLTLHRQGVEDRNLLALLEQFVIEPAARSNFREFMLTTVDYQSTINQ